ISVLNPNIQAPNPKQIPIFKPQTSNILFFVCVLDFGAFLKFGNCFLGFLPIVELERHTITQRPNRASQTPRCSASEAFAHELWI
ncbi:MAG: hypothetical protein K9J27_02800, partial [Bacteroidales bacterium]|nr:hypothetical protein [Bacteroidales bacterium]MCF8333214.1 hypothetical protein [Bacteroidales bacterium]